MSKSIQLTAVPHPADTPAMPEIRTLKKSSCSNLSGNATLKYEVACNDANDLFVCVRENSGKGFFAVGHWVSLASVQQVFSQIPEGGSITSYTLQPLFKGMSSNNSGFLLAVMKDLRLVQTHRQNPRCYEVTDGKAFFEEMQGLMTTTMSGGVVSKEPARAQGKKAAA